MLQSMSVLLIAALVFSTCVEFIHSQEELKEVNPPATCECDRSQQEECCTTAEVGHWEFTQYTEMSARGRHTVVNMTSAGLQEYTMYFALQGEWVELLLSPTSPRNVNNLYYKIGFTYGSDGQIYVWKHEPRDSWRRVLTVYTATSLSRKHYIYYYLRISGDTMTVGKRGEPPLLTHSSAGLRRLKYFSFAWEGAKEGVVLYDCPAE